MSQSTMSREERECFLADLHMGFLSIEQQAAAPLSVPVWYDDASRCAGSEWIFSMRPERWRTVDCGERPGRDLAPGGRAWETARRALPSGHGPQGPHPTERQEG